MRLRITTPALVAALLIGSVATAQDSPPPAETAASNNAAAGTEGGGAANNSASSGSAPITSAGTAPLGTSGAKAATTNQPEADEPSSASFALQQMGLAQRRWWLVGAEFETHRLLRQEDLGGAAKNKALNFLQLYAGVRPTAKDQISVRGAFFQRFLADGGETGFRADDITVTYNHLFMLPGGFALRPSVGNVIPISFNSRLMGLYASPRASVLLMGSFLNGNLSLFARGGGSAYITEYRQYAGGGSATPLASTSVGFGFNYSIPFHRALQVGGSVGSSWWWLNEVEHANDPSLAAQFKNTPIQPSADPQFASQPVQQTYAGEVYLGYQVPNPWDAEVTLQLALSQGDANNVIHDGRSQVYWMFRRTAQTYLALQVQY